MDGELSPEELATLLEEDPHGVSVVDIRSPSAFARGHIPGSVSIPFQEVPTSADRVADADRIVTVCPHGEASVRAARLLAASSSVADDVTVESMAGGITSWSGDLVEADPDETADAPF